MNEYIGWIGAFMFAICTLPQAIKTYKTKQTDDLSALFLWLWFLGEIFTIIYIVADDYNTNTRHYPLYINYVFNLFIAIYMLYAKHTYSRKQNNLS